MRLGLSKTRLSPIAIDFGADSVKLLQVVPGNPPQFVAAETIELDEAARTHMATRASILPELIRKSVQDQPFRGKRVICSVPAFQTIVQNLQITRAAGTDFEGQVSHQLHEHLNVDPSRMVVRALPVDLPGNGGQKQEAVCMAAGRDVVMRYIQIVRSAKLDVVGLHCEPVAIMASFKHLYRRKGDEQRTTAFIDIGAAMTKVVIAHGAEVVFAKVVNTAGDQFTRHFARVRGMSFDDARNARRESAPQPANRAREPAAVAGSSRRATEIEPTGAVSGVAVADPPEISQGEESIDGVEIVADSDAFDCLIDELKLCLRYHENSFPDRPVEKLVFLGGEARQLDLCQRIARTVRIAAQLGDPLARLTRGAAGKIAPGVDLRQPQPGWAVPMGLCLCDTTL